MLSQCLSRKSNSSLRFFSRIRSEREKMLAGEMYFPMDPELVFLRHKCRDLIERYNTTTSVLRPEERKRILKELFGQDFDVYIEPPYFADYGINTTIGKNSYFNYHVTILDVAPVKMGDNTFIAPNASLYTATHPVDPKERCSGYEFAKPITLGHNCWLGGSSVICPGVTLGDNVVVGAGAVVTKSFPSNVVIAGNPARVIRNLTPRAYDPVKGFK